MGQCFSCVEKHFPNVKIKVKGNIDLRGILSDKPKETSKETAKTETSQKRKSQGSDDGGLNITIKQEGEDQPPREDAESPVEESSREDTKEDVTPEEENAAEDAAEDVKEETERGEGEAAEVNVKLTENLSFGIGIKL